MHPLLKRQLKKVGLDETQPPTAQQWAALRDHVAETYGQADQDRYMLERSLAVCSEEMTELYEDLHRRSEDALARRTEELEQGLALATAIQEGVMHGIVVVDKDGNVTFMNTRFVDLMRVPAELHTPTTKIADVIEHCISLAMDPALARAGVLAIRADEGIHASDDIVLADGRVIDGSTGPVVMKDGAVRGRLWSMRDVTDERKLAAQRLIVAERLAAVGQLVASVAHEINNPLAAILGNIEFVAEQLGGRTSVGPEVGPALTDARDGLERIRLIARDLRMLSRADDETHEPVDLNDVMESALHTAANQLRHRARIVRELTPVPLVEANDSRLHQVFLNLLVNAAQAIPEGRANDNVIVVRTEVDPSGNVCATVRDTGAGIAADQLERIFDPFFSTKPIGVGTGLGLPIVKGIVEGFGGKVRVTSQLGKGTSVTVELPRAADQSRSADTAVISSVREARKAILVVDDDQLSRRWIERALSREHVIFAVGSVDEALEALQARAFDVIFCDVMMPNRTGRDLYRHLEQTSPAQLARFVFMTGGTFTDSLTEFLESVPVPTLDKPMSVDDLRAAIESIDARERRMQQL